MKIRSTPATTRPTRKYGTPPTTTTRRTAPLVANNVQPVIFCALRLFKTAAVPSSPLITYRWLALSLSLPNRAAISTEWRIRCPDSSATSSAR